MLFSDGPTRAGAEVVKKRFDTACLNTLCVGNSVWEAREGVAIVDEEEKEVVTVVVKLEESGNGVCVEEHCRFDEDYLCGAM